MPNLANFFQKVNSLFFYFLPVWSNILFSCYVSFPLNSIQIQLEAAILSWLPILHLLSLYPNSPHALNWQKFTLNKCLVFGMIKGFPSVNLHILLSLMDQGSCIFENIIGNCLVSPSLSSKLSSYLRF